MKLICNICSENFEHHRKRKSCLKCVPERIKYNSEEDRQIARRKQNIVNVQKRREKIKKMAIEYKGGKCQICKYDKCISALEFHLYKCFRISSS